jgi:hypothetical protein
LTHDVPTSVYSSHDFHVDCHDLGGRTCLAAVIEAMVFSHGRSMDSPLFLGYGQPIREPSGLGLLAVRLLVLWPVLWNDWCPAAVSIINFGSL